jgi:hypothetical protein
MTIILFAVWSLTCVGVGIALTFWVAAALAARAERDADPLAEYTPVDAPEHAPSVN